MVLNNLFTGHHWSSRHRKYTYVHGQMGGEDEMYGKCTLETCVTICKIDSKQEFAVWFRKLKQGLCINLEEWTGDGRTFQKGRNICISMADSY